MSGDDTILSSLDAEVARVMHARYFNIGLKIVENK